MSPIERAIFGLAVLAVAVAPSFGLRTASALATSTWLGAKLLGDASVSEKPQVAIDSKGNVAAVWQSTADNKTTIRSAMRPAGSSWSFTDSEIQAKGTNVTLPQVAVDESGNVVAVWQSWDAAHKEFQIEAAVRPRLSGGLFPDSSSWSKAAWISETNESGASYGWPRVAVSAAGEAAVVWNTKEYPIRIHAIRGSIEGGEWTKKGSEHEFPTGDGASVDSPDVAVDDTGKAIVVWRNLAPGEFDSIQASIYGGFFAKWSDPVQISSPTHDSLSPQVAVNASGKTVAAWRGAAGDGENLVVEAAIREPGDTAWTEAAKVSALNRTVYRQRVSINADGAIVAVWEAAPANAPNDTTINAATWPKADKDWTEEKIISTFSWAHDPVVGVDDAGNALAVWRWATQGQQTIYANSRPVGGDWGAKEQKVWSGYQDVSPDEWSVAPQIGVAPTGDAVAVWETAGAAVEAAGYDASGPKLTELNVPTSGKMNSLLSFTVAASDVWSPAADIKVKWSFGDNTSAAGLSVSHAYVTAGDYTVKVTATDGVGNKTVLEQQLKVPISNPSSTTVPTNTPTPDAAGTDTTAPTVRVKKPKNRKRYKPRALRKLIGTAADSSGIRRVEYALAKKRATKRRGARRYKAASGNEKWQVKLKRRLPKGAYTLYVRATDNRGNTSKPVRVRFAIA